ncbi:MAG: histidine kinase [Anaerolineae bacterium]|nr:MAG: histidine kinase [Anaerolineae bacterium]
MPTVRSILEEKGDTIYAVDCSDTVYHALEVMAEHNIGAVLVAEGDRYVGIFTERDYARRIILKGHDSRTTQLKDIMTKELVTVAPDTSAEQCMALMTKYHIRHLPVVEEGRIIGLVSIGDVVKQVIANRESTIAELENYILGTGYGR